MLEALATGPRLHWRRCVRYPRLARSASSTPGWWCARMRCSFSGLRSVRRGRVRRADSGQQGRAEAGPLHTVFDVAPGDLRDGGQGGCDQVRLRARAREEDCGTTRTRAQGEEPGRLRPRAGHLWRRWGWSLRRGAGCANGARVQARGGREGPQRRAPAGFRGEVHKGGVTADREQALSAEEMDDFTIRGGRETEESPEDITGAAGFRDFDEHPLDPEAHAGDDEPS